MRALPLVMLLPMTAAARAGAPSSNLSIDHDAIGCVVAGRFTKVETRIDPGAPAARARAYFRAEGGQFWYYVDLKAEAVGYSGVLPRVKKTVKRINYYLDVLDPVFAEARTAEYAPVVVGDIGQCKGKLGAIVLSTAKLVVGAPPGAPPVPEGFEAAGIAGGSAEASGESSSQKQGKPLVLILGVGAAAAAGGVALAAGGGGGGSGSASSSPATAAIASISPAGTALVDATVLTFTASASGGGSLTVKWDFGDGASASGSSVTHVYGKEGTFQVVLTVSSGSTTAQANASVAARSLTGTWTQVGANDVFTLEQVGAAITGQDVVNGRSVHSIANGKVANVRDVSWDRLDNAGGGGVQDHVAVTANDAIAQLSGTFTHRDGSVESVTLVRR